jgi:hypothetical protein
VLAGKSRVRRKFFLEIRSIQIFRLFAHWSSRVVRLTARMFKAAMPAGAITARRSTAQSADTRECGRRERKLASPAALLAERASPARLRAGGRLARGEDATDGARVVVRPRLGVPAVDAPGATSSRVVDGAILLLGG